MHRKMTGMLLVALLAMVWLLPAPVGAQSPAAMEALVASYPDTDLFQGKTQDELAAEVPVSAAYFNVDSVIEDEVEVTVAGQTETVAIYRYQTPTEVLQFRGNILWTVIAGILVFLMQGGFAALESGLTRAKNAVNVCMKNLMDFSVGTIAFFAIGFHIMFAGDEPLFFLGNTQGVDWGFPFWFFQCVFAATAATICSGAMAERTKFTSYLIYSFIVCAVIYPVFGRWAWGSLLDTEGFLESILGVGFYDFAGTTVVHGIGAWCGLAGAIVLGPRIGKYGPDGSPRAIPPHNFLLAMLGGFILWFGWYGFNPGSTTTFDGNLARIAVVTTIAGAIGSITAMFTSWSIFKKPDASMALNGCLAGMVAICTAVDVVTPFEGLLIGGVAGVIVVLSVITLDRVFHIDDPVGAVSVHGFAGVWGTLAYAFFGVDEFSFTVLLAQALGILIAFAWAFGAAFIMFSIIKATIGLRVSREEELAGLDISEHGMEAYSGFQIFRVR